MVRLIILLCLADLGKKAYLKNPWIHFGTRIPWKNLSGCFKYLDSLGKFVVVALADGFSFPEVPRAFHESTRKLWLKVYHVQWERERRKFIRWAAFSSQRLLQQLPANLFRCPHAIHVMSQPRLKYLYLCQLSKILSWLLSLPQLHS